MTELECKAESCQELVEFSGSSAVTAAHPHGAAQAEGSRRDVDRRVLSDQGRWSEAALVPPAVTPT